MKYKNTSLTTRKFYGVTFKPGETKDVKGYINDPKFVKVSDGSKPATNKSAAAKPENKIDTKAEVK